MSHFPRKNGPWKKGNHNLHRTPTFVKMRSDGYLYPITLELSQVKPIGSRPTTWTWAIAWSSGIVGINPEINEMRNSEKVKGTPSSMPTYSVNQKWEGKVGHSKCLQLLSMVPKRGLEPLRAYTH